MGLEWIRQKIKAYRERRLSRVRASIESILIILVLLIAIIIAAAQGNDVSYLSDVVSTVVPLATLAVLLLWHQELLSEQSNMRRLQTRPQVLVYFERKPSEERGRERLVLAIKHFGGGPALDVQFAFKPPLVNHEKRDFQDDPPLSTGIAVMPPGYYHEMDFSDFGQFHSRAGLTRVVSGMLGTEVARTRLTFEATVSLRDPIGDDQRYTTTYRLDLSHLMPYTMDDDD